MSSLAVVAADGVPLEQALHLSKSASSLGTVVQVHGINADMDEGGMYVRLADRLAEAGFGVLRFSFRGHGGSGGTQQGATIAGELLDLQAAINAAYTVLGGPISVVASSFGAVSLCQSLPHLEAELRSLVLWNPVLDLHRTFVEPVLPWGMENFGPKQQALLGTQGFLCIDGEFEVGRVLFEEMRRYHPREHFVASRIPALVVHGDRDTAVSYEIARGAAEERGNCEFHTVRGSDHGFDSREHEDEAIDVTTSWLVQRYGG